MIRRLVALVAILAVISGSPALAQDGDAEGGVIQGTVANGTADSTPVDLLELTLMSYTQEGDVTSMTTTAGADGAYRFAGVSADHQLVHQVEV